MTDTIILCKEGTINSYLSALIVAKVCLYMQILHARNSKL